MAHIFPQCFVRHRGATGTAGTCSKPQYYWNKQKHVFAKLSSDWSDPSPMLARVQECTTFRQLNIVHGWLGDWQTETVDKVNGALKIAARGKAGQLKAQELLVKEALPIQMPPWRSASIVIKDRKFLAAGLQWRGGQEQLAPILDLLSTDECKGGVASVMYPELCVLNQERGSISDVPWVVCADSREG